MTGVPSKGSANIVSGVIVFHAPDSFVGNSEVSFRIQDSNWNIDILGTVTISATQSTTPINNNTGGTTTKPVITGNTVPVTNPITKVASQMKWWYYLIGLIVMVGAFLIMLVWGRKKKKKS